jgi:hypothetical protein
MDTYGVEKTPIKGVWKLGKLDPTANWDEYIQSNRRFGCSSPDRRVKNLIQFLGLSFEDRSHANPQNPRVKRPKWHVDAYPSDRTKTIPGIYSNDMITMISGEDGTLFRKSNRSIWKSEPWTIYFINYDVVHASPLVDKPRLLHRFDLDREKRGRLHPKIGRKLS